ncbi:hypothetical protein AAMO2058_001630400 [Amorphochlora amoebiformis]
MPPGETIVHEMKAALVSYLLVAHAARVTEHVHLDNAAGSPTSAPTANYALQTFAETNQTAFLRDFNPIVEEFKNGTRMLTLGTSVIKESAGLVTFARTYTSSNSICGSATFLAFDPYQATLAPSVGGLTRLDFGSSISPTFTCTDASIVNQIAAALSSDLPNPTLVSSGQVPSATLISRENLRFSCDGLTWLVGSTCSACFFGGPQSQAAKSLVVTSSVIMDDCRCTYPAGTLVLRPQIGNLNFGGFGQTCSRQPTNFQISFTCQLDSCRVADDPHVRTFSQRKFAYSGTGEHILAQWKESGHENKISSCFFDMDVRNGKSFQKSVSYTCKNTHLIVQRSVSEKLEAQKLRVHFFQNETLLPENDHGDFLQCSILNNYMSCTCSAERNVRLVVTGKRFKGKTYINSELRMLRMKEEENLGGFCQGRTHTTSFLAGPNNHANCKSVSYPTSGGDGPHDPVFADGCGPASWKVAKGTINLFAERHNAIEECV